jgi:hypothetical protein
VLFFLLRSETRKAKIKLIEAKQSTKYALFDSVSIEAKN